MPIRNHSIDHHHLHRLYLIKQIPNPHNQISQSHMMSPDNQPNKEDNQSSCGALKKANPTTRPPDQKQALKCPRCDSPNTKFCYYNNYSLSQPRHFCKTCRRYWTKGGALRNVPMGGGCRKKKKVKSSSSSASSGSSEINIGGGLNFIYGLSPAMDFQLGGLSSSSFLSLNTCSSSSIHNQYSSSHHGDATTPAGTAAVTAAHPNSFALVNPSGSSLSGTNFNYQPLEMSNHNVHNSNNIASSIASLSCINQELHWKLQQQRLQSLHSSSSASTDPVESLNLQQLQKPQSILFQNMEISKPDNDHVGIDLSRKDHGADTTTATEWLFGNSYARVNTNNASSGTTAMESWNSVNGWSDLNQYGSLP